MFKSFSLCLYSTPYTFSQITPISCKYIASYSVTKFDVCVCWQKQHYKINKCFPYMLMAHILGFSDLSVVFQCRTLIPLSETISLISLPFFQVINLVKVPTLTWSLLLGFDLEMIFLRFPRQLYSYSKWFIL